MQAVVHPQQHAGFLRGGNHRFALLAGDRHGLLHHDVLACLGTLDGILGVHRIWQCDMNHVDAIVFSDFFHRIVGVDRILREAMLSGPVFALRIRTPSYHAS